MSNRPTDEEVNNLFANSDPAKVWEKASEILKSFKPNYDFSLIRPVYEDVMNLFHGHYPGYVAIKTLYHDLPHTLDVYLCAARLMHGMHISGEIFDDDEITLVLISTLMHDIGYAQREGEETGTGAQYTQTHVKRGIAFMKLYFSERNFTGGISTRLEPMILCTDPALNFSEVNFPGERIRLLGQLVVTADLTGQMADRTYLEKLLFLYLEFREAHFGDFQSIHDMLRKTERFYEVTREKLDGPFGRHYVNLALHFREMLGVDRNYYFDSIEKNILYLKRVIAQNEAEYLSMLKRGGIVERAINLVSHDGQDASSPM